jgi:predicted secreted protein
MGKSSAFGTVLNMGNGSVQVETATLVGTITNPGDIDFTITAAGMTGSPLTLAITVANGNASTVAASVRSYLSNNVLAAPIRALFDISGANDKVILTRKIPMANDATLNMASATGTATGLTTTASSANTTAGETLAPIAYVSNISGPGLSADTEDITTHDSTGAWEEHVVTILRTGELSVDIVYDPAAATHGVTTGLVAMLEAGYPVGFSLVFPAPVTWAFAAVVTGFEPSAPHDGALTASVKMKLTGAPILV